MLGDHATNAAIATVLGAVVAVVLLLPVAAVEYRRDGRLTPQSLVILLSSAVYGLALWTYTLLPLPADGDHACAGKQTTPFGTIDSIGWHRAGSRDGLSALVQDPSFLQVALNVLLFVPLGYFVRRIARRGVVVATGLGLGISLLIETTQATGVWGIYDCPYRLFDVDDLMVNTLGATVGSLIALVLVRRQRAEVVWPTSITFGRRLVGMICDLLFVVLLGSALVLVHRAVQLYVVDVHLDDISTDPQRLLQWGIPVAIECVSVLCAGRTVGEWVVSVRSTKRTMPTAIARPIKLLAGIGPFIVLLAMPGQWTFWAAMTFAVITALAAVPGRNHRGLSHALAGLGLEIVQPPARANARIDESD